MAISKFTPTKTQTTALDYWKTYLSTTDPCMFPLLTDNHGDAEIEVEMRNTFRSIEIDLAGMRSLNGGDGLNAFCAKNNISVFDVLKTAWAVVLREYVGIESVCFAVSEAAPASLSLSPAAAAAVGVDSLNPPITASGRKFVCKANIQPSTMLAEIFDTINPSAEEIAAQRGEDVDLDGALEGVRKSVFNTALQSCWSEAGGLCADVESAGLGAYDVVVAARMDEASAAAAVELSLNFSSSRLSPSQATSVACTLAKALSEISRSNLHRPVGEIGLCSDHDRSQILLWNPLVPQPVDSCLHGLVEARVATQPDAQAVYSWDGNLSYRELDDRSSCLAQHLVELGVGPDVLVPLCFQKSAWAIVAMFAVLKAGGACVSLDPSHPVSRLEGIVGDVKAILILAGSEQAGLFDGIDVEKGVVAVTPQMLRELPPSVRPGFPSKTVQPGHPAFVVFTSGSTGTPKGIVLEHRAISTSARANGSAMRINRGSRVLQFAAYTFDVSIEEIFVTLAQGGCVCSPSEHDRANNLAGFINAAGVNWADLTPTVAGLLRPSQVPGLKSLALGGEALTKEIVQIWSEAVQLVGMYGPAECSISCAGNTNIKPGDDPLNIGRGIGSLLWIVDVSTHDRLAPIGTVGELLIEGPMLARGYLNDQKKTDAAFIENPEWANCKGGIRRRFYKTGDLVRYNSSADGTINFVGRKDTQVKVRGQRVELGEIEHHLKLHVPNTWQLAVEMIKSIGRDNGSTLAAFVCINNKNDDGQESGRTTERSGIASTVTQELQTVLSGLGISLAGSLPPYMIPSVFIPLEQMPLTVSGKTHRRMLHQLASQLSADQLASFSATPRTSKRAPSTDIEEKLQLIWADLLGLGLASIGLDDSFFRLGGDSIGAMKLVSEARMEGIALTVFNIFRNPTLSAMAALATTMTDDDDESSQSTEIIPFVLLEPEEINTRIDAATQCGIPEEYIQDIYPCTPLQEGLMALSAKHEGSYLAQNVFALPKNLDIVKFRAAWDEVVRAAPILRTRIIETTKTSRLHQVVLSTSIDWISAKDLDAYLERDRGVPIHLGGPLTRYAIIDGGEGDGSYHFVWTAHHAVYDGWSIPLILENVERAFTQGTILEKPAPFSGFIRYILDIEPAASEEYWRTQLAGSKPSSLPPSPPVGHEIRLDTTKSYDVTLSKRVGSSVTISTIIRAAWAMVVARYSDTDDVVFGVTLSGRNASVPGIEGMVGPTITTMPIRIQLQPSQEIGDFLQQVQDQATGMIAFEHTGLQNIRKTSAEAKDVCDFTNLLVIQPSAEIMIESGSFLHPKAVVNGENFLTYPLTLECTIIEDGVRVLAHHDPSLIDTVQMQRILHQFGHVLQQLATKEESAPQNIADIELISPQDKREIFLQNQACPEELTDCVHHLIEEQVFARPNAPAICSWDGDFTYKELDGLASKLAFHLAGLGVGPEVLVPLCFSKSAWTIVAQLAVLKAGGAIVPIDPAYPSNRIESIISDTCANVVLVAPEYVSRFHDSVKHVVAVEASLLGNLHSDPNFSSVNVGPHNPVFVVFTSGSTGKPKGIVLEHAAFCTSSREHAPALKITRESRVLQFAAYTYDVAIGEIFTTLTRGGCICVPSEDQRINNLAAAINDMKVNWTFLTPTVASLIQPADVPNLKVLVLGGEHATRNNVASWADSLYLINSYGPAECSIWTTCSAGVKPGADPANIGSRVGCLMWVVDTNNHQKLSPLGCVGELVIESFGLARGYLNDKTKTEAAFIENPAWMEYPSGVRRRRRLYKTGDLVRCGSDGSMMIVGRRDTQVKVRGQRVELGEIEHHLIANPLIDLAVVTLPKSGPCQKRLVAVMSLKDLEIRKGQGNGLQLVTKSQSHTAMLEISGIREQLRNLLPPYMVPTTWVAVEEIPLMSSGKTDRGSVTRWLEAMDEQMYQRVAEFGVDKASGAPTTPMEAQIQIAWSTVLNIPTDQIGTNRSFLGLGGDSISAMLLTARCKREGILVSVQDVLRCKTITELASKARSVAGESSISKEEDIGKSFELSPIQKMFFDLAPDGENHFNQSFLLQLTKKIHSEKLTQAIEALIDQHSMFRARFRRGENGHWTQTITKDIVGSYRFQKHQISSLEQATPIMMTSQKNLDIQGGPIFSVDLFCLDDGGQALFLLAHHLVVDLVSWRIILQDLEEVLMADAQALPTEKPLPFQTWCRMQAEYSSEHLNPSAALPHAFDIPTAVPDYWGMTDQVNKHGDVIERNFTLSQGLTSQLLGESNEALGTDPIDLFNAAVLHSFHQVFQDRESPAVFNEGHGREPWDPETDLSRTVGWFTTMFPIYVPFDQAQQKTIDTVRRTKDFRRRIPNKGWAYFASRFLNPGGINTFGKHSPIELTLNYMGLYQQLERKDALFRQLPSNAVESDLSTSVERFALLDVLVAVEHGQLQVSISWNRHMKHQDCLQAWVNECEAALEEIANDLATRKREYTLSDFPLLPTLTYQVLTDFIDNNLPRMSISDIGEIEDIYPCAPMQQGILVSQTKKADYYNVQYIWELANSAKKNIDSSKVLNAWQKLVDRHAILRTVFVESLCPDNFMDQVVLRKHTARTSTADAGTKDDVLRLFAEQSPIDHEDEQPSHRLTLGQTLSGELLCKLEISHALIDGASMSILLRDLRLAYDGTLSDAPGPLYSDYVSYLQNQSSQSALEFWKNYLIGVDPCYLPTLVDLNSKTFGGELRSIDVKLDKAENLHAFCEKHGVTMANIFQLVWAMVLRNYIGTDSVCFGFLVSGRDMPVDGIQDALGPFINMLICRMHLTKPELTLAGLLEEVQTETFQSLPYQGCSLARIHHELGLGGLPLFNTALSLQKLDSSESTSSSSIDFKEIGGQDPTEYDLTVHVGDTSTGAVLSLSYWSSRLSDEQVTDISSACNKALTSIIDHPDSTIAKVDLYSDHSRKRLWDWNKNCPVVQNHCAHQAIGEQALKQPERPAICSWDGSFTYKELDSLASRLAHHLIGLGVGPETIVPLCFEKSAWTIVSMLAVLKAGGAFVPMDPSHPTERLESIMRTAGARLFLTSDLHSGKISGDVAKSFVVSHSTLEQLPFVSSDEVLGQANPDNTAYVIFTSGSTGQPKGVIVQHAALSTGALEHGKALHIYSTSRVLQFASYTFDACIIEILTTLIRGGCVCVPSESDRMDNIVEVMNEMEVDWAVFTPSFVRRIDPSKVPGLKTLVLAGEAAGTDNVEVWADKVRLVNGYGPSECTVCCLAYEMSSGCDPATIGHAVGSLSWIVDAQNHNRLVPIGGVGELLVEGPILARGYLNDSEKTAAAFVVNPTWMQENESASPRRLYKTGDLVRYNLDGTMNFVGRKDTQVKVRGQRVELGEIEYCMSSIPIIKEAIVTLPVSGLCKKRLVAVLSLSGLGSSDSDTLQLITDPHIAEGISKIAAIREQLWNRLPPYMIPAMWVCVRTIPLLTSGKADRQNVSRWLENMDENTYQQIAKLGAGQVSATPTTATEQRLQRIWSKILGIPVDQVATNAPFLSLGGDSISAMMTISHCKKEGIIFGVQDVLRKTISELAEDLGASDELNTGDEEEFDSETPFDLSPVQEAFFEETAPEDLNYVNQSLVLELTKSMTSNELSRAIDAVIERHPMLRARFRQSDDGCWNQFISSTSDISRSYRLGNQGVADLDKATLIMEVTQRSLDIQNGPVFAMDLINTNEKQVLFVVAHRLVADQTSWSIILKDLEQFLRFQTLPAGRPLPFQSSSRLQAENFREHVDSSKQLQPSKVTHDYWGMQNTSKTYKDAIEMVFKINPTLTSQLVGSECNKALRTEPIDIFNAAALYSFYRIFPDRGPVALFNESRNSQGTSTDLSKTVGWVATMNPIHIPVITGAVEAVRQAKVIRRHGQTSDIFGNPAAIEMVLNYSDLSLGHEDSLFRQLSTYNTGRTNLGCGPKLSSLIDIFVTVDEHGYLQFSIAFSQQMMHQVRIQKWVREWKQALIGLARDLANTVPEFSLSDFPLLPSSYQGLGGIIDGALPHTVLHEIENIYPCSRTQQGMLISQAQNSSYYDAQFTWESVSSQGNTNCRQLLSAWQKVVYRHAALRTVFVEREGKEGLYDQIVFKEIPARMSLLESGETNAFEILAKQSPLDYTKRDLPHRLTLCRTPSGKLFCKLEISHTITDGTSMSVILHDLSLAYDGKLLDGPGPRYDDYIVHLVSQPSHLVDEYWCNYLKDITPCYLPVRNDNADIVRQLRSIEIELDGTDKLSELCQLNGVTLSNVFQLVWGLILRAYIGMPSASVCFGYIVSGRDVPIDGIQDAVGPFINLLPCRIHLADSSSISDLLGKIQADFVRSLPYQHCSMAKDQPSFFTSASGVRPFNTLLNFRNFASSNDSIVPTLSFDGIASQDPMEFDVVLAIENENKNLNASFTYWNDRISDSQAAEIASKFRRVIYCITKGSCRTIRDLDSLMEGNTGSGGI